MATSAGLATVIGAPISPYVRKVLTVCEMKAIPYQVDPIVPFLGNDTFSELNPLRRVPVFIDDQVSVSDSTVICEYRSGVPGPGIRLPVRDRLDCGYLGRRVLS